MTASVGKPRRVLIIVENLPVPFDRRVWQEARTLHAAGYAVSVICPVGKGYDKRREVIDGVHIFRHRLPMEAEGALGYAVEYGAALAMQFYLSWKVYFKRGFDVIHACNPPDTIFLIARVFKLFGVRFIFDHHDINPELYQAKFGRRDMFYRLLVWLERRTFRAADVSLATNESYRRIAVERGGMAPQRVFIVRSGPDLTRLKVQAPTPKHRHGRTHLVGYVGVMGRQEGIDYLLRAVQHVVYEQGRSDIHFTLVGGGTSLQEMQEYAAALGVAPYVTFTGRVSDAVLLEVLNTADVCVNPDVANVMNDKSTMNKIMEYMALGKPIVQFDLTEGRYSAQDASLYARHNDAEDMAHKIVALIDAPERRAAMGRFGRERVERELAWEFEAPKLLRAYDVAFGAAVRAQQGPPTNDTETVDYGAARGRGARDEG